MKALNRRAVVQGLGVAAIQVAAPLAFAQARRQVKVTQAITSLAFIQSYVAAANGYFQKEGLEVEVVNTGGGGPDVQLVLGGRAEFTVNDGAQVLPAIQQGQKLICVQALLNRSIVNVTMGKPVAERLGITQATPMAEKLRKLKGLKIGVTRPGALTWQLARYNLFSAGLNPDNDAEIIGIGDAPSLAAALRRGNIDAIYISVPIGETLVSQGVAVTLIDNSRGEDAALSSFLMEGLWTTPEFARNNKEVVQKTVRAYRAASRFVIEAPVEEVARVVKPTFSGLADEVLLEGVKKVRQAVSTTGEVDQVMLDSTQKVLEVNKVLTRRIAMGEVFDSSYL